MSFLLDTDICSAYLKNDRRVVSRVMLHYGALRVSVITQGELLTWALRAQAPRNRGKLLNEFLAATQILPVDELVAQRFGELRSTLLDQGLDVGAMDLLNASVALVHDLTMVTHNTRDYVHVPGLTLEDWLDP